MTCLWNLPHPRWFVPYIQTIYNLISEWKYFVSCSLLFSTIEMSQNYIFERNFICKQLIIKVHFFQTRIFFVLQNSVLELNLCSLREIWTPCLEWNSPSLKDISFGGKLWVRLTVSTEAFITWNFIVCFYVIYSDSCLWKGEDISSLKYVLFKNPLHYRVNWISRVFFVKTLLGVTII